MPSIGPRNDHEFRVQPRGGHRGDFLAEILGRDELLAVEMAAPLWEHLVLHVQRRSPRPFVLDDGPNGAFNLAIPGIGISNHRDPRGVRDFSNGSHDFRERQEADVGSSRDVGGRAPRNVTSVEPCFSNRHPDQRVEGPGNHDDVLFNESPKAGTGMLHGSSPGPAFYRPASVRQRGTGNTRRNTAARTTRT